VVEEAVEDADDGGVLGEELGPVLERALSFGPLRPAPVTLGRQVCGFDPDGPIDVK